MYANATSNPNRQSTGNFKVSNQTFDLEEHIKNVIRSVERRNRKLSHSGHQQQKSQSST